MSETPKCDAAIAAVAGYDFEQSLRRMQSYEAAGQEESPDRCPECRHFLSCNHARTCSRQSDDQLRQAVSSLIKDAERDARHIRDAHIQRLAWYGKWMAVKQENNALRKANRALRVALANLQIDKEHAKVEPVTRCAYQLPDCHCPRCTGRPGPPPKSFYCDECGCCAPNCPRCIAEGRLHVCTAKNKENPNEPTP